MTEEDYQTLARSTYDSLLDQGVFDEILAAVEAAQAELDERIES